VRAQEERRAFKGFYLLREYISNYLKNVSRKIDGENHTDEVSDGNQEYVTGQRIKESLL
jgi:hypothetical protein